MHKKLGRWKETFGERINNENYRNLSISFNYFCVTVKARHNSGGYLMGRVYYGAFISYSHNERDTYIAKRLHFMLEHYRISRKIRFVSGKAHITRVFRDQEELTLSSDLPDDIKEALENSELLIVICLPKAAQPM